VLEFRDVDKPNVENNEVLIRIHATGVERGVWHLMTGLPYLVRPVLGTRKPKVAGPGP
jgi:NADPH:quinone reductase-like Zn-dependent oxidoreductase